MKDVPPFLVPSPGSISATKWERLIDGEREELGDRVQDWDQQTFLHVSSSVSARCSDIRDSTRLPADVDLVWVTSWTTDTSLIGDPVIVPFGAELVDFSLTVPPDRAGGAIRIGRKLVLGQDRHDAGPGEPRHAGSVLWADEHPVRLAGDGAAFPTEIVDFAVLNRDRRTSWYLDLPDHVNAPAMGSMLLMINAADSALIDAVTRSRRRTALHDVLLHAMEEGVVEELVRWALARWDDIVEAEDETVGAAARALTTRILADPDSWSSAEDSMALRSAIVGGARQLGFGRGIL